MDEIDANRMIIHDIRERINELDEDECYELLDNIYNSWIYKSKSGNIFEYAQTAIKNFGLDENNLLAGQFEEAYKKKIGEITYLHLKFMKDKMADELEEEDDDTRDIKMKFNKIFQSILDAKYAIKSFLFLESSMSEEEYVPTDKDVDLYRFIPMDYSDMSPYQKLLLYLLEQLQHHEYRRYDGECYKQLFTEEGYNTHSWRKAMSIKQFINNVTDQHTNPAMWKCLTSSKDNCRAAVQYLTDYIGSEFEDIVRDRHVFSFKNGVYIAKKYDEDKDIYYDQWIPYGSKTIGNSVVACKYFNDTFIHLPDMEWFDIIIEHCPNFKGIMDYQEWPEEVQKWLCIMIGRCMYDLGEIEEWQVMGYLLGQAGSGKSTILTKIVKIIYETCDVGVLSNNIEKKFGLSALEDKFLFIGPEIKGNLSLEQSEFQSLISGEDLQIAKKMKTAQSVVWKVPGFLAGNEVPSYTDNAGSISRRLLVYKFDKKVQKGDTRLGKKLAKELGYIMQACNRAYQEAVNIYGEKDIWSIVPKYFKKTKDQMAENTNALTNFLKSDKVRVRSDLYVRERIFLQALKEHCSANNLGGYKWNNDYYLGPFETFNLSVEKNKKLRYPNKVGAMSYVGTFIMGCDIVNDMDNNEYDPEDED